MGMDFPSSPVNNDRYSIYTYDGTVGAWKKVAVAGSASTYNRVVNGGLQISEQNGNTVSNVNGYYPADQWFYNMAGASVSNVQRVQAAGSANRIRLTVTTADTVVDTGDVVSFQTRIEGNRIADFKWGTASAQPAILRFGFKGPAGTYSAGIRNGATTTSYVASFTIGAGQANTDTLQTFAIPGCTTGAWTSDTSIGAFVDVVFQCGATRQGTANAWSTANVIGSAANTNGVATVGNTFEVFEIGLYLDANNTGVAPAFQERHYEESLQECMRYFQKIYVARGAINTATQGIGWMPAYVPMRVAPALTLVGTIRGYDISVAPNITSVATYQTHAESFGILYNASGFTLGRPFMLLVDGQVANYIAASARM